MTAVVSVPPGELDFVAALTRRYSPGSMVLHDVASRTGLVSRRADAVVVGLWPSRGMALEGFEFKSHRSDWLREMRNPQKAEEIARYMDRWWLLTAPGVCQIDECPLGWGLMELHGDRLRTLKPPKELKSKPIGRPFVAAMLRRALVMVQKPGLVELRAAEERGFEAGKTVARNERGGREREYQNLQRNVADFEKRSGINIAHEWELGNVALACQALRNGLKHGTMEAARNQLRSAIKDLDAALKDWPVKDAVAAEATA